MKQNLTDWFPPDIEPVRSGVYEIEGNGEDVHFAHWMPNHGWGFAQTGEAGDSRAIELAYNHRNYRGEFACKRRWRGLATNPKPCAKKKPRES